VNEYLVIPECNTLIINANSATKGTAIFFINYKCWILFMPEEIEAKLHVSSGAKKNPQSDLLRPTADLFIPKI
jgi:hypothetical protein